MAGNYAQLLDIINNPTQHGLPAWDNNAKQIEGETIQQYLLSIINSLTVGYQFMGVASTNTSGGTPDQNVFYLAGAGTYNGFGSNPITIDAGYIGIIRWNGAWSSDTIKIADMVSISQNTSIGGYDIEIGTIKKNVAGQDDFLSLKSDVFHKEQSDVNIFSLSLLPNYINFSNVWVSSETMTHIIIEVIPNTTIQIKGVSGTIIAFLKDDSDTGVPSFSDEAEWNHRVEIGGATRTIVVPKDAHYLYCRGTEANNDYRPSRVTIETLNGIECNVLRSDVEKLNNSYPSTLVYNAIIRTIYTTFVSITGLTLIKGHRYTARISVAEPVTFNAETNLKIMNGSSDSTVKVIKSFSNGDSINTSIDVSFEWDKDSVDGYRIGWYQNGGTAINKVLSVQLIDITIENIDTVDAKLYQDVLANVDVNIANQPLLNNYINYANAWVSSTNNTHLLIEVIPDSVITILGVSGTIIAFLKGTETTGTPSFSDEAEWNHRVEIGATTQILVVPSDAHYLYCRATEPNDDFRPSNLIIQKYEKINIVNNNQAKVSIIEATYNNECLALGAKKAYVGNGEEYQDKNRIDTMLSIIHITDSHDDFPRIKRAFMAADKFGSTLINTGDTVIYSTDGISPYVDFVKAFSGKYLHCMGNHDTWNYAYASQVYNKWFKPFINELGKSWVMASIQNPTYYYWDDDDFKVRYIAIDQWRATGTSPHYYPTWTQDQIDFVISSLQSVPSGYGVIVLMHSPEVASIKDDNYPKFYDDTENWSGLAIAPVTKLIDAFISKTSISETVVNSQTSESLTLSADFSNVNSNEFIAYICGHTHKDYIHYVNGANNLQLVLCETCTTAIYSEDPNNSMTELSDLGRSESGLSQDAFNIYVVDRLNKRIKIVRLGADMPFEMESKRDYMVIPYN